MCFLIDRLPLLVMSETTEQKLDALMKSVSDCLNDTKRNLDEKFKKLEEDIATCHGAGS